MLRRSLRSLSDAAAVTTAAPAEAVGRTLRSNSGTTPDPKGFSVNDDWPVVATLDERPTAGRCATALREHYTPEDVRAGVQGRAARVSVVVSHKGVRKLAVPVSNSLHFRLACRKCKRAYLPMSLKYHKDGCPSAGATGKSRSVPLSFEINAPLDDGVALLEMGGPGCETEYIWVFERIEEAFLICAEIVQDKDGKEVVCCCIVKPERCGDHLKLHGAPKPTFVVHSVFPLLNERLEVRRFTEPPREEECYMESLSIGVLDTIQEEDHLRREDIVQDEDIPVKIESACDPVPEQAVLNDEVTSIVKSTFNDAVNEHISEVLDSLQEVVDEWEEEKLMSKLLFLRLT